AGPLTMTAKKNGAPRKKILLGPLFPVLFCIIGGEWPWSWICTQGEVLVCPVTTNGGGRRPRRLFTHRKENPSNVPTLLMVVRARPRHSSELRGRQRRQHHDRWSRPCWWCWWW